MPSLSTVVGKEDLVLSQYTLSFVETHIESVNLTQQTTVLVYSHEHDAHCSGCTYSIC
jgi:hypothetical protein